MKQGHILAFAALLSLAGCATKRPAATAVPPPPASPAVAPKKAAKPRVPAAPAAEAPAAPVPARAPITLESRTDPAVDRAAVDARVRGVQSMLTQLNARTLTGAAKDDRDRVTSMLAAARQSLNRGELQQANDISARAETLGRTLLNAR